MKTLRVILLSAVFLISGILSQAQSGAESFNKNRVKAQDQQDEKQESASSSGPSGYQYNYLNLGESSSMYLDEEWSDAVIKLEDGTKFTDRKVRYNIYNQQMEYIHEKDTSAIGNPEELEKLMIDDRTFVYEKYYHKSEQKNGYLELVEDGKYSLFMCRGIKYTIREEINTNENEEPGMTYFLDKNFYYAIDDNATQLLPERKKDILALFDVPQKKLNEFLKKNNNRLKTEKEFVELFKYVNEN